MSVLIIALLVLGVVRNLTEVFACIWILGKSDEFLEEHGKGKSRNDFALSLVVHTIFASLYLAGISLA